MTRFVAVAALTLAVAGPLAAQNGVTIYQDGRVLHRRILPVRVPSGASTHQIALGALDASSLFALDADLTITGARYDPAVDETNALRRAVGRQLSFATRGANGAPETVVAEVVGVDPERFKLADGRITFQRPGTPLFPADLVPAQGSLSVALRSERARNELGLGYFSIGASWNASYALVLGKATARVSGQATVAAGALRADSVEVQLLAGNVGAAPKADYAARDGVLRAARPAMMAQEAAGEQAIGEVHLYSLPGRWSLVPGVETVAMLFDPAATPYERAFTVQGRVPYWGGLPQEGDEQTEPVTVTYIVKRAPKTAFGDLPLPGGVARLYERDAGGRPQLIGESTLDHTAAGQDLRLDAGTAFDLTARRVQTAYETRRENNRTLAFATYTVTLANAKDSAVTIDVLERRGGEWTVLSSSVPAQKISSTTTRFRVAVPGKGQATVTYRVRVVW